MLKFWKKKPTETGPAQPTSEKPANAAAPESGDPLLHEALAEVPAPAETQPEAERFVAPTIEPALAAADAPARRSWRERLSGNAFARGLGSLFVRHPRLDDDLLDELETTLITADVGVEASSELVEDLRKRMHKREFADAASVIFDALQAARSRGIDVLIADTAGRLHTQGGLMDELGKIARVLKKLDADAPHEVLMVIDGTTGQNAVSQVRQFRQIVGVTGLVVTKLDGTAKGGVVFALAREFGLPIRYVGLGETATDLRVFEAEAFVDGLLPASLGDGHGHD
jgi:signal recognition particle GTPase